MFFSRQWIRHLHVSFACPIYWFLGSDVPWVGLHSTYFSTLAALGNATSEHYSCTFAILDSLPFPTFWRTLATGDHASADKDHCVLVTCSYISQIHLGFVSQSAPALGLKSLFLPHKALLASSEASVCHTFLQSACLAPRGVSSATHWT